MNQESKPFPGLTAAVQAAGNFFAARLLGVLPADDDATTAATATAAAVTNAPAEDASPTKRRRNVKEKRPRGAAGRAWTEEEAFALRVGALRHTGKLRWSSILKDPELGPKFMPGVRAPLLRTAVAAGGGLCARCSSTLCEQRSSADLKDKWVNMTRKRRRSDVEPRKFLLLDKEHKPLLASPKSDRPVRQAQPCSTLSNRRPGCR